MNISPISFGKVYKVTGANSLKTKEQVLAMFAEAGTDVFEAPYKGNNYILTAEDAKSARELNSLLKELISHISRLPEDRYSVDTVGRVLNGIDKIEKDYYSRSIIRNSAVGKIEGVYSLSDKDKLETMKIKL